MSIDPTTMMVSTAGALTVAGSIFALTTLQRHNDRPNRLAAASLLATFIGLVAGPAIGTVGDMASNSQDSVFDAASAVVALVLTTVGLAGGTMLVWMSAQAFGGRRPALALASIGTVAGGTGAAAVAGAAAEWALLPAAAVMAVGAACSTVELRRSSMASNLNSLILEALLWVTAVAVVCVAVGIGMDRISIAFGWAAIASVGGALGIAQSMTLMALRVERYGNWWTLGEDLDRSELGVDERESFLGQARDRIERCRYAGQPVHVITTALPGLTELNLAYGHLAGDAAMRWVAELLRLQAPTSAVLGHLGAGRFAIVTSREPELVANSVQNGMMRVPPPATLPVRLTPVFAWASSDEAGHDFDLLRQTAEERLSHVS